MYLDVLTSVHDIRKTHAGGFRYTFLLVIYSSYTTSKCIVCQVKIDLVLFIVFLTAIKQYIKILSKMSSIDKKIRSNDTGLYLAKKQVYVLACAIKINPVNIPHPRKKYPMETIDKLDYLYLFQNTNFYKS